jgi:hypothetical protein
MDIDFVLRGIQGRVSVTFSRNEVPELVGSGAESVGFPTCDATVDYPANGYNALLGWVQLVRSDDNISRGDEFEIDPLDFLGDVPHPFCWIGIAPRLFDAPSRSPKQDLGWTARSFLCVPDGSADAGLEVHALLGFSWGFSVRNEEIRLVPPTLLGPADWDEHKQVLTSGYAAWRFVPGFREG